MQNWIFQEKPRVIFILSIHLCSFKPKEPHIVFQNIELSLKIHTPILVFTVITDVFADEKKIPLF